jgi:hypothetical protein
MVDGGLGLWLGPFCFESGYFRGIARRDFLLAKIVLSHPSQKNAMDGAPGFDTGMSNRRNTGSLHCAVHDETVNSFGRDDEVFGRVGLR